MIILITGVAGFIGFHTAQKCLEQGWTVVGIDNMNDYYSPTLKKDRLGQLQSEKFVFCKGDLVDQSFVQDVFQKYKPEKVLHLAAQPGVRYSLVEPEPYVQSNIVGFFHIIEAAKQADVDHFIYASSSSVYGANRKVPFSEHDHTEHPVNLYAASKKANEMMAHSYSHLYGLPTTGLRFFTVYGPWGRPDMAPFIFTDAILQGKTLQVYGHGQALRDFTYIDDIVDGVFRVMERKAKRNEAWNGLEPDPATSTAPYEIFNIGNSSPVKVIDFIEALEEALGIEAKKDFQPLDRSEVQATHADMTRFAERFHFQPRISLNEGVKRFVEWYKWYEKKSQ
ncbi:SDR family NAD(P)-dependent oxidoreductase [Bacillus tianshenii]|nr:SDR family NAD(P)-dependent oxidoreductase [Bacillus tianshenii]